MAGLASCASHAEATVLTVSDVGKHLMTEYTKTKSI